MKNEKVSKDSNNLNFGRRDFLALSVVTGGGFLFAGTASAQPETFAENDANISENIIIADSLILYSELLDGIRRFILQKDIDLAMFEKTQVSEVMGRLIELAKEIDREQRVSDADEQQTQKFYELVDKVKDSDVAKRRLDVTRSGILVAIKKLDSSIDEIKNPIIEASQTLKKIKDVDLNKQINKQAIEKAKGKIDEAIIKLKQLDIKYRFPEIDVNSDTEESNDSLVSNPKNLIELLESVKDYLDNPAKKKSNDEADNDPILFVNASYNSSNEYKIAVAGGISDTLQRFVDPGTWIQISIGYGVTFPILFRVTDKLERVKLLKDVLRLVPGLKRNKRVDCARALADL